MQKLKQAAAQCPSGVRFSKWIALIRFFFRFGALLYHLFNVVDKLVAALTPPVRDAGSLRPCDRMPCAGHRQVLGYTAVQVAR